MPFRTASETPVALPRFEAYVVFGAHAGEEGDLFAAETLDATPAAEVG